MREFESLPASTNAQTVAVWLLVHIADRVRPFKGNRHGDVHRSVHGQVILDYLDKHAAAGRKTGVDAYLRHMVKGRKALWVTQRCLKGLRAAQTRRRRGKGPQSGWDCMVMMGLKT